MKIAYLVSEFPKLSETFVSRELLTLAKLGLPVILFAFRAPPHRELRKFDEMTRCLAERTQYVSARSGPSALLSYRGGIRSLGKENARLQRALMLKSNLQARMLRVAALARHLERAGVTHLHAHWPYATQVAYLVSKLTGIPFSISIHAHEVEYDYGHFPAVFDSVSFATFCNRAAMERLLQRLPDSARQRAHLIYHGVDLDRFRPLPFPEMGGPLKVISAGRMTRSKGFERLVRACATARSLGTDVELTIIGEGNLDLMLKKIAIDLGFAKALHLPGWLPHDQMATRFAESHVFGLMADTDFKDGLPNVVLEGMAAGRPVIVSPLPAAQEAVTPGVEGIILNSAIDEEGMVNALRQCAADRSKLARMGQAARRRVEQDFDQEMHALRLKQLFEQVIRRKPNLLAA